MLLPKHIYQFGRHLRIHYDSQPNSPTITDEQIRQITPQKQQQLQENTHTQLTSEDEHQISAEEQQEEEIPRNITIIQQETLTPITTKKTKKPQKTNLTSKEYTSDTESLSEDTQQTSEDEQQTSEDEQQTTEDEQPNEQQFTPKTQYIPKTQQEKRHQTPTHQTNLPDKTPKPNIMETPTLENDEKPFITIAKRKKQNSILWWTSAPNEHSVRPKYKYNPNELYRLISKDDKMKYYQLKAINSKLSPLLKDNQRKIRAYCIKTGSGVG